MDESDKPGIEIRGTEEEVANVLETFKGKREADFTVTRAQLTGAWGEPDEDGTLSKKCGFEVSWGTKSAGFGSITFYKDEDGNLKLDSECMSKQFCLEVLYHLLVNADDIHQKD